MTSTLLCLALLGSPQASGDALSPAALAARTPPDQAWDVRPVDIGDYFSNDEIERWRSFRGRHRTANLLALALDILTYLLLLGGPGRWLWDYLSRRKGGGRVLARVIGPDWRGLLLFAYVYFAVGVALDLPFSIWHELINREAGLSTASFGLWVADFFKALLLGAVLFTLLVTGLYGLIRRFPRSFWLILALPVALVTVGYGLLSPYATRLYQQVRPIERAVDPALAQRLRRLARAGGVALAQIKVVDTSRRSRAFGAHLTGFGPTRELVLSDTLLASATHDEVAVVVAHELGHREHERLALIYGLAALGLVLLLGLLAFVLRVGARLMRLDGPGHIRTLPLIGLTAVLLFNLALPLRNLRSCAQERAADRHALAVTGDPEAFISIQVKLARRNRADVAPSRWVKAWLFSHPPVTERIAAALWYQRWLKQASPKP